MNFEYDELTGIMLNEILYSDNREAVFNNVKKEDFINQIDKDIFDYYEKKIKDPNVKRVPKINELIIESEITYNLYQKDENLKKGINKIIEKRNLNKFNKNDVLYIVNENSSSGEKFRGYIKDKIKKRLDLKFNKIEEIEYYIEKFKNKSHLKKIEKKMENIQAKINDSLSQGKEYKPAEIFSDGFNFLFKESMDNRNLKEIVEAQRKEAEGSRIKTYFDFYDNNYLNGGIKHGYIEIIGAETSMGKSTYAINRFYRQVINKKNVYYITFEENKFDILEKILTIHSNHNPKFKKYNLSSKDWADMGAKANKKKQKIMDKIVADLSDCEFENRIIDMRSKNSVDDVEAKLMNMYLMNEKKSIDLIYLDHIHNISSESSNFSNFTAALKHVMGNIRVLASKSKLALSILTQLNDTGKKRPTKKNLKWSQALANDAQLVTLLYRRDYGLSNKELESENLENNHQMELIIDKNRYGKTGTVNLYYDFEKSYIREWKTSDNKKASGENKKPKKEVSNKKNNENHKPKSLYVATQEENIPEHLR